MTTGFITQIAGASLGQFDGVMGWLGLAGGKFEGKEYLPLNPKRNDAKPGSFSINRDTAAWADFAANERGGDLVSLTAYLHGVKQYEAAKRLGGFLGMEPPKRETNGHGGSGSFQPTLNTQAVAARSSAANDNGELVSPVPDGAPPPFIKHYKRGVPSMVWAYRDANGSVLFYLYRFELPDGSKDIRPLSLRRMPSGKLEWRWVGVNTPRPLYGLDKLAANQNTPVMICEGEKACDAARVLFPGYVVVTSPNGAKAADKANWEPLRLRDCTLWPDADEAGGSYALEVEKRLQALEATKPKRLNLDAFLTLPDGSKREALPVGWDAADALADGYTAGWIEKQLARLLNPLLRNEPKATKTKPKPESKESTDSEKEARSKYTVDGRGVWFTGSDRDGNPIAPKWVCAPLKVLARVRDPHDQRWGKLVEFNNHDGRTIKRIISDVLLCGEGNELERVIRDAGLDIAPKARIALLEYLITCRPEERARVTQRTGWHESEKGRVFMLPEQSFGNAGELWLFDSDNATRNFKIKGELEGWKSQVAALCVGNSRLVFAVSMAFAAPLLHLVGAGGGGFHLRGSSSDGKTTALMVAASVCGGPDYMHHWRATDNSLESLALLHCDAPLLLDELHQIDPKVAGEAIYMLANGSAKARAQRTGGLRDTAQWRSLFLSTGEIGLGQHLAAGGKEIKAGMEVRLAEIPAYANKELGIFESLHDMANGAAFSKALAEATKAHYGAAFPAYLEKLVTQQDDILERFKAYSKRFNGRLLTEKAGGQAERVANRFALVGFAGELATEYGITGWEKGEASKAALACFSDWLINRGGEGNLEKRAMFKQVREFLATCGESAFTDWARALPESHAPAKLQRAGYRKIDGGDNWGPVAEQSENRESHFYIFPDVFANRVCKGLHAPSAGKLLLELGCVEQGKEADRVPWVVRGNLPIEGRTRYIHVLPKIFEIDDENI